jgi:restriction system protein
MRPVLELAAKSETSVPGAEEHIAAYFGLSEAERGELLPSGKQKLLHNRIHWAKFYLSKAGLVTSPRRGRFVATEAGRELLSNPPAEINARFLMSYQSFRDFMSAGSQGSAAPDPAPGERLQTPEESIDSHYTALVAKLRSELMEKILANDPAFFEQLIVELLTAMGYGGSRREASQQLGRSGDGGVDGVINEDLLGLDRLYVQAKRYAPGTVIGRPDVQAFTGSLVGLNANKGVFVTTSSFSQQAVEYAERIPQRVILIDGTRLTNFMIEHGVGVRTDRTLVFKRLDEDFFSGE